ncbi:MAG TPA: carboxypeptidase regulatory-like domain-containing protein [Bryobacteraceae bacterium]|nr:carboxypeptidase regulatory-like domain-containing protein [Bryobacteraceae bacterium]
MQRLSLVFGLLILASASSFAQTATILGTVTDPTGSVVPAAKVTITNRATSVQRVVQTNSTGSYIAPELPIGVYSVRAEAAGFKAYERTDIKLDSNDTVRADAVLQVGQLTENVTVEADVVKVESDTSEVSDLISGSQVQNLAINGRHFAALAILTPGASSDLPDFNLPISVGGSTNISFNGEREEHNVWMIDGGENYDRGCGGCVTMMPSIDAISEVKTLTSNAGSDFGVGSGGTINMNIKSGTRDLHGEAYEFFRNDYLDANNFFANLAGTPPPELRYNIFGWNLGGPVTFGKLYNKDRKKTFFFWNQEWRKFVIGSQVYATAIPQAQRNGDFSALSTPITVPNTNDPAMNAKFAAAGLTPGQPFPGNKIPASLIDPNASLFLASGAFPLPNAPNNFYSGSHGVPTNVPETLLRFDHYFTDKLSIMGHYIHDNTDQETPTSLWTGDTYPTVGTNFKNPSWGAVAHLTYVINPTLLNEAAFNFNGNWILLQPIGTYKQPAGWSAQQLFNNNLESRMPTIGIGGSYGVTYDIGGWPWRNAAWDKQARDDVSWTKGSHSFHFGGQYMRYSKNQDIFGDTQGNYSFNGSFTGNAMADFLLGYASSYSILDLQDREHTRNNTISFYGTDDWRITKRLTLNLGVRWEIIPHVYDIQNRLANFYPNLYNPADAAEFNSDGSLNTSGPGFQTVSGVPLSGIPFYLNGEVRAGQNGIPKGLVENHYGSVGPRVGFAYDLTGKGKTVIRGGYGMFYERIQGNDVYNMGPNPPFGFNPGLSNVFFSNPNTSVLNGQAATVPIYPAGITALSYSDYKIPASAQWNLGIQHEVTRGAVAAVQYVGNADYHQRDEREINAVPLSDPNRSAIGGIPGAGHYNVNLDRPYLGYSNIELGENASNTHYESLQVSLRVENQHGLTLSAAYTWSHNLGIAPGGGGDFNELSDPYNRHYDFGPTGLDRRQVLTLSYIYDLPIFRDDKGLKGSLLGGWELAGITLAETGLPLTPTLSLPYDNLGLGGGTTDRPNIVGPLNYPKTRLEWFDTADFAAPAALAFGDAQEGAIRGPSRLNFNLSMYKFFSMPWREGMGLRFGAEFYNALNHTQFHDLNTSFGSSAFGQATDTYDPRTIELSLKLRF